MPWKYEITTGKLTHNGEEVAEGYSGRDAGKNNPAMQDVRDVGPIPVGFYAIGRPFSSLEHGPEAMHLMPAEENTMFGRAGFLMHGDSIEHPGQASHGCIIMPRWARDDVAKSGDFVLEVTA